MKVTLDLTDLVARGELSQEQADRLARLAAADTGSLGANILIGFGIVVVALGIGALVPSPVTGIVLGAVLFALGMAITLNPSTRQWDLLGQTCLVLGALVLAGSLLLQFNSLYVAYAVTLGLALAAVAARSGFLGALAMLSLAGCLGSSTDYAHAVYSLSVPRPAVSVGVFAVLAILLVVAAKRVPAAYERVALISARTAALLVNVAFLVGSLWGDPQALLNEWVFIIGWAVGLLAAGAWGLWSNRRWVVNTAAVFGAIHFYTQWFEHLGASAGSVLGGGLLMLIFGFALWSFNQRSGRDRGTPPPARPPSVAGA